MELGEFAATKVDGIGSARSPDAAPESAAAAEQPSSSSASRRRRVSHGRCREPLEPLIVAALRSAPGKRLLLADIYRYIETHSADYRPAPPPPPPPHPATAAADTQSPAAALVRTSLLRRVFILLYFTTVSLQCFGAVGWAAGRASH